jgi:cell fate regulator YaaT (PSP1 superfamily)
MPGTITPLPVLLEEEDQRAYDKLEPPKTMVVRYGYQRQIAELPYGGDAKPGCGSKLVVRTPRGVELAEMLTTTCGNSGCGKSVSRKEMLDYIEASGGRSYPFTTDGRVMRVATVEDLAEQAALDADKPRATQLCRQMVRELDLQMQLVEVELLLGGERAVFYFKAEQRVDFRELVRRLASEMQRRIEMVQVNDREEARLVADYEKCGQHCCCRQFLKVLKPVSMRSAKVQKATLDPQKISGRCGRLMCCLRYEDETYEDLRKRLPNRKTVVRTPEGLGVVVDSQILTQLVLVKVAQQPPAAFPVEDLERVPSDEAKTYQREQREAAEARGGPRAERRGGGREPRGPKPEGEPRRDGRRRGRGRRGGGGSKPDSGDGADR